MDIYIIKSDINKYQYDIEKFCHKSFKNKQKQFEHSFSYYMLDKILKEKYNIKDRTIEFINEKPFLKTKKMYISMSHSGNYITLAFSDNDCGIDIEKVKERDYKAISERMNFECNSLQDFYKKWTKYEAEYKLGEKQDKSLKSIEFENYILTAVCEKEKEEFQFYIQITDDFSKLTV